MRRLMLLLGLAVAPQPGKRTVETPPEFDVNAEHVRVGDRIVGKGPVSAVRAVKGGYVFDCVGGRVRARDGERVRLVSPF